MLKTATTETGGIHVPFIASESIASYLSQVIDAAKGRYDEVLRYLVVAILSIRFGDHAVSIRSNVSPGTRTFSDTQADIRIGDAVFLVAHQPRDERYAEAWRNAEAGKHVYLLVPNRVQCGMEQFAELYREGLSKKVDIVGGESFLTLLLDKMANLDPIEALRQLHQVLTKYNELVARYENDPSLKIVIPDFGVNERS
jgi:hypothetical protein